MRNIILLVMVVLVVSCTTTQKSASDPLPQTKTSNFVVTDFRNIAQENVEDYLKVEKFRRIKKSRTLKNVPALCVKIIKIATCYDPPQQCAIRGIINLFSIFYRTYKPFCRTWSSMNNGFLNSPQDSDWMRSFFNL